MVKITNVQTLVVIDLPKQCYLHQMDVENAFFTWKFKGSSIYGTSHRYPLTISNLACKLIKSLYSLKKAPRAWFENDYLLFYLFSFLDSSKASMITHFFHLVMELLSFFIY